MGSIRRAVLAGTVLALLMAFGAAGEASAATPWWKVRTLSAPAGKTATEGVVVAEVANLGDAVANRRLGSFAFEPVTVADKLPPGVTATAIVAEGGGGQLGLFQKLFSSCSLATTTCTFGLPVMPYDRVLVDIRVKVAPGSGTGQNEVSVSGGVALPAVSRQALALEGSTGSYGIERYELAPEEEGGGPDTQAGSHPFQLTTSFTLNLHSQALSSGVGSGELLTVPYATTKDLRFNLPAGLVGNPTPVPKCSIFVFTHSGSSESAQCPVDTVVGTAMVAITFSGSGYQAPLEITTPLYNLVPALGEPVKFGFMAAGFVPVILDASVRTGGDYGVVVNVSNIASTTPFVASQVTFWGAPTDPRHDTARGKCLANGLSYFYTGKEEACPVTQGQPFLIMPTACTGPPHTSMEADTWSEPGIYTPPKDYAFQNSEGEPFSMDGCNRLNFEPSIKVSPDGQQAATPTGLTVDVHVPQDASLNPAGIAESTVKDTTVALPAGVGLNPSGADGLQSCSLAQVGLESAAEQSCPEAAKVGTVEIRTPLLPHPLVGAAYLAQQYSNPFGSLIALYLVVKDPYSGVIVKLAGQVRPDPVTGQLVSTFDNTPPLPFEDLSLHFFGGSRAPLGTPAYCGSYATTASIAPWSGNAPVASSSTFQIVSGPNNAPCENPLPFGPELTTGSLNIQAGAFTPFTMTMSREDGNQNLDAIQLKMPSGLLGEISKVKLCGEAQANAGSCGPESEIGETTVSVGLGGNPYTVRGGRVYITGPYAGAPYGLSIVNPAKAGPFDLGQVVVRAKIEVDPTTAAITITSDTSGPYRIPQIIDGIPLEIKHVNVTVNRPEFTFNPTDCEPQQIGGALTSSEGATSVLHVPFQVTNCATLGFKPIFKVSTSGKTSRAKGASLHVKLTYPKAPFGSQANIGYVKVDLPKQLPSRLETLKLACPDSVFNANPAACPVTSHVGYATASTPVLPAHLSGPAYFVSHGGAKFPELIIALAGEGITVYLHGETFISKTGITSSTFKTIPDVPIGTFELTLPEGPYSALAAPGNHLCGTNLHMPTAFHAANGVQIKQSTPITVTGCPKHKPQHPKHNKHHKNKHNKKK